MKTSKLLCSQIIGLLFMLGLPLQVGAALIGLSPSFPDLTTFNASIVYNYSADDICADLGDPSATGVCGTDNGKNGGQYRSYTELVDAAGGDLSITGVTLSINLGDGLGPQQILSPNYSLLASFDVSGNIVSASLDVDGTVNQTINGGDPESKFQSGSIADSVDLIGFGFEFLETFSGSGVYALTLEFIFDNSTGDLPAYGNQDEVYVIAATSGAGHVSADSFLQSFSGSGAVDTFIPLPAGVWLFGSALCALGVIRKNRR